MIICSYQCLVETDVIIWTLMLAFWDMLNLFRNSLNANYRLKIFPSLRYVYSVFLLNSRLILLIPWKLLLAIPWKLIWKIFFGIYSKKTKKLRSLILLREWSFFIWSFFLKKLTKLWVCSSWSWKNSKLRLNIIQYPISM